MEKTRLFHRMLLRVGRAAIVAAPGAPDNYPYGVGTRLYPEWPFAKLRHTPDELAQRVVIALLSLPGTSSAARSAEIAGWTVPRDYQPGERRLAGSDGAGARKRSFPDFRCIG